MLAEALDGLAFASDVLAGGVCTPHRVRMKRARVCGLIVVLFLGGRDLSAALPQPLAAPPVAQKRDPAAVAELVLSCAS